MAAFRAAVEVGVHCIETDVHATRDNVAVLSHVSARLALAWMWPDEVVHRTPTSTAALEKTSILSIMTGRTWPLCDQYARHMSPYHD